MKPVHILSLFLLLIGAWASAQTTPLTVEQCRQLALQNSPLQQKKLFAESISLLQIRNLRSSSLPRIQFGAQATWQSDVFGLPFKLPGSEIPEVPKDQYKVTADIAQRIWDGGTDKPIRQQRELERELSAAQVEVDVFMLREIVTDLYFKALLLQESLAILDASTKDLETRLKQTEASVQEGVALKSSADQVRIQILKTTQQMDATKADYQALLEILAKWVGQNCVPVMPESTPSGPSSGSAVRPEHTLFALQQRNLQIGKDAQGLRAQPRLEAFVQGGLGRPNPFNFFETDFKPFVLLGLRAAWTPVDWGNIRRDKQVFDLQIKQVDIQRQFFDQRLEANTLKDQLDEAKYLALLTTDDAIISLQTDIIRRADAQVKNGVMTMTDYLAQLNLLTQAQLSRKTHVLQAWQAREMRLAKLGPHPGE